VLLDLLEQSLARGHWKLALRRYLMLLACGCEVPAAQREACERHLSGASRGACARWRRTCGRGAGASREGDAPFEPREG
jgi:hypothetical protein